MRKLHTVAVICICFCLLAMRRDPIPTGLKGSWQDDYGITYHITDTLWTQEPGIRYHVIRWDTAGQWMLARNDQHNPSEPGLYTRIDYMTFRNMAPWRWGFCLTVYNAASDSLALSTAQADRLNPRKGCNGFPFSRMKPFVK